MGEILLKSELKGERLELLAFGSWTAPHAGELETLVDGVAGEAAKAKNLSIDMSGVREFDTFGAWLLERLTREGSSAGRETVILGLPPHDRGLLEEMHSVNRAAPTKSKHENAVVGFLAGVAQAGLSFSNNLMLFANMLGAVGVSTLRVLVRPREFRLTSTINQLDRVGWQAVPIILLITFLIGGIISQQGIFHFRKFGAELYVGRPRRHPRAARDRRADRRHHGGRPLRQLLHCRARLDEDARGDRRAPHHGLRPDRGAGPAAHRRADHRAAHADFPRLDGGAVGGGLVAWLYGGISPDIYTSRLIEAISLTHFKVGMLKAPFMGLMIGIVACAEGLQVKGSAKSLGLKTTDLCGEVDLPGDRARRVVRHLLRLDRDVSGR